MKDVTNKSAVLQIHPHARFHLQVVHELKNENVFKVSLRFQSHFLEVLFFFRQMRIVFVVVSIN